MLSVERPCAAVAQWPVPRVASASALPFQFVHLLESAGVVRPSGEEQAEGLEVAQPQRFRRQPLFLREVLAAVCCVPRAVVQVFTSVPRLLQEASLPLCSAQQAGCHLPQLLSQLLL